MGEPRAQDSNPRELWAQAKNCYRAIQSHQDKAAWENVGGRVVILEGLKSRTPVLLGLEDRAWSQRALSLFLSLKI